MITAESISSRLKQLRRASTLTQAAVASGCGIPQRNYAAYEEGRCMPGLPVLFALKKLYGFKSIDQLLDIKEEDVKQPDLQKAYYSASIEKRKIVDFILNQKT